MDTHAYLGIFFAYRVFFFVELRDSEREYLDYDRAHSASFGRPVRRGRAADRAGGARRLLAPRCEHRGDAVAGAGCAAQHRGDRKSFQCHFVVLL